MKSSKVQAKGKTLKPLSTKKPPVATDSHSELDEMIRRKVIPDMQPLVKGLDELIRETVPGLQYAVKWGKAYYCLPDPGWIIEMVPYQVSVNVVFFGGADFDPPPPLGSLGRSRYIKLTTLEKLLEDQLKDLYSAETQLLRSLPKVAKAASSSQVPSVG
jgi:hypothetical protein